MASRTAITTTIREKGPGLMALAQALQVDGVGRLGVVGEAGVRIHPGTKDTTVAELAAIHEFGLGPPARPWLSGWLEENRGRCQEEIAGALRSLAGTSLILRGARGRQLFQALGTKWAAELAANIRSNDVKGPPLAPATVKAKGHDTKLLDTGTLADSISFDIVHGKAAKALSKVVLSYTR